MAVVLEAFLISLFAGLVLWALVPRGVVLTRSMQNPDPTGPDTKPDTWWLTNASAVPALITSMTLEGIGHTSDPNEHVRFIDHALEAKRENHQTWEGVIVPPGEIIEAHVRTNHDLSISYRRDGLTGVLERRTVKVTGYA